MSDQEQSSGKDLPEVLDSIEDLEPEDAAKYELRGGKYYYYQK
jgi:hypothetical protein